MSNISKSDLAKIVAGKIGTSHKDAEEFLGEVLNSIAEEVTKGNKISLIGFGSFVVKKREARKGRNPKTGEEIQIAAKNAVQFKVGKGLSDSVNA